MSSTVRFGNPSPQMQVMQDGQQISVPAEHLNQSVTVVELQLDDPDVVESALSTDNDRFLTLIGNQLGDDEKRFAIAIYEMEQIVATHTGGSKPTWIEADDQDLEAALAAHFQCARGDSTMLLTTVGRDAIHAQHLGTQVAIFNYMALTANTTAPAAGDTTLTGEIATASGGLIRATVTFAHTAGTNTSTLTKTFTANANDSLPVTIAQIGVFNAASSGTLAYHTALSSTATLSAVGDNVTVTETIQIG